MEAVFGVSQVPPRVLRFVQAHYRALLEYRPQPYAGRLDLFRARTGRLMGPGEPDLGWGAYAAGGVAVHVIPGTHESMIEEPHVRVLAEKLTACLDKARQIPSTDARSPRSHGAPVFH
jgi:aspartate racemase